jgi:ABC-2 type transport system ATP-binding protein
VADGFVIETADLRKSYDGVEALRGLNLRVPAGSICGFLGRNGAGKTTTIKVLMGMAHPTSGEARVFRRIDRSRASRSAAAPASSARTRISTTA